VLRVIQLTLELYHVFFWKNGLINLFFFDAVNKFGVLISFFCPGCGTKNNSTWCDKKKTEHQNPNHKSTCSNQMLDHYKRGKNGCVFVSGIFCSMIKKKRNSPNRLKFLCQRSLFLMPFCMPFCNGVKPKTLKTKTRWSRVLP